ncbi:MAG TPA: chitobiase/beta-hexosaminidase C-terminal domain-containing protein, partial [Verrucomicrobiae bacterium]
MMPHSLRADWVLRTFVLFTLSLACATQARETNASKPALLFEPPGGVYQSNLLLRISTEGGIIHYTLNGTE